MSGNDNGASNRTLDVEESVPEEEVDDKTLPVEEDPEESVLAGADDKTLPVEDDKTLPVEDDSKRSKTSNGPREIILDEPGTSKRSGPAPNLMASLKRLTDAKGVPLETIANRRQKAFKISANLGATKGRLRRNNGSFSQSFMGLMSDNYKNNLTVSKRGRIRDNLTGKSKAKGKLKRKQPSYESGSKFNLAATLGRGSSERLKSPKPTARLRKAGDIKLMIPKNNEGGARIQSIQRQKFVPKNRALKTVRERRNDKNFRSGSRMMNDFGDASHGTVEVDDEDEGYNNERQGSFVPESKAIKDLQNKKLNKLGEHSAQQFDTTQLTLLSGETDLDNDSEQDGPFIPQNSVIKKIQQQRQQDMSAQKISKRNPTENTLVSEHDTVVTEQSDPFLRSQKTPKPQDLSSRMIPKYVSSRRVPQLTPQQQAAKESFRLSVAHFVNQTSDRRSVSFMNSHRSVLRGPSVRLSMAGANNAQDIVREIQERQRQQDEILSKLYRSRKFRQAERSRRGQAALSANIRASMQVRVQPIIRPEVEEPAEKEHNRAKHYREHGMLGFFSLSALGKGCDRAIDLTELVPLDVKVVVIVIGIASAAAYVIFLFTADYSVDTLGLE